MCFVTFLAKLITVPSETFEGLANPDGQAAWAQVIARVSSGDKGEIARSFGADTSSWITQARSICWLPPMHPFCGTGEAAGVP